MELIKIHGELWTILNKDEHGNDTTGVSFHTKEKVDAWINHEHKNMIPWRVCHSEYYDVK